MMLFGYNLDKIQPNYNRVNMWIVSALIGGSLLVRDILHMSSTSKAAIVENQ